MHDPGIIKTLPPHDLYIADIPRGGGILTSDAPFAKTPSSILTNLASPRLASVEMCQQTSPALSQTIHANAAGLVEIRFLHGIMYTFSTPSLRDKLATRAVDSGRRPFTPVASPVHLELKKPQGPPTAGATHSTS